MQSIASTIPSRDLREPYFSEVSHSDQTRDISSYTCLYRNNTDSHLHLVSHQNIISAFGCIKVVVFCLGFFERERGCYTIKAGATSNLCYSYPTCRLTQALDNDLIFPVYVCTCVLTSLGY